jgi:hypothetical protein
VLGSFVTKSQDKKVALKFLKKAMKKHGRCEQFVTDILRSYGAALKDLGRLRRKARHPVNRANLHAPQVCSSRRAWRIFVTTGADGCDFELRLVFGSLCGRRVRSAPNPHPNDASHNWNASYPAEDEKRHKRVFGTGTERSIAAIG